MVLTLAIRWWLGPLPLQRLALKVGRIQIPIFRKTDTSTIDMFIEFLLSFRGELAAGLPTVVALQNSMKLVPEDLRAQTMKQLQVHHDDSENHNSTNMIERNYLKLSAILQMSERTGAPLLPSIDALMESAIIQQEHQDLIRSELASTKATVMVLATLPLMGLMLGMFMGLNPLMWLISNPIGWLCLLAGLSLQVAGVGWIKLLIRRASVLQ